MTQTVILKNGQHTFPAAAIGGNLTVSTNHPASGSITYNLAAHGPVVVPLPGGSVYSFVLPVNGHPVTVINNTTSGLSCIY